VHIVERVVAQQLSKNGGRQTSSKAV